jgi:hypothetical protein
MTTTYVERRLRVSIFSGFSQAGDAVPGFTR